MQDSSHIKRLGKWLLRPRISLRGLLVLVALISVVFFGVASVRRAYEKDRAARAVLESELGFRFEMGSSLPDWVCDLLPVRNWHWFDRATMATADRGHNGDLCPTFSRIADCKHVRTLLIERVNLDKDAMLVVGQLQELRSLDVRSATIDRSSLEILTTLPNLRGVGLLDWLPDAVAIQSLTKLKGLEIFELSEIESGADALRHLDVSRMQLLTLVGSGLHDEVIEHVKSAIELRHLELRRAPLSDRIFASLASCRKLETLIVSDTEVTGVGIEALTACPLNDLSIERTRFDDTGAECVGKLKSLNLLDVSETNVTAAGLAHLVTLPKLKRLTASNLVLDAEAVGKFEFSNSLEVIDFNATDLDDRAIDALLRIKSLWKLSLRDCPISNAGKARLRAAIRDVDVSP
jgi:hypothetical protein